MPTTYADMKQQIQELPRSELEIFLLNSLYKPLDFTFMELLAGVPEERNTSVTKAKFKDCKNEIDAYIHKKVNVNDSDKAIISGFFENINSIKAFIQRGDYDNSWYYLLKLTRFVNLFMENGFTKAQQVFPSLANAWNMFILMFTCPFYTPQSNQTIDIKNVRAGVENLVKDSQWKKQFEFSNVALDGWNDSTMKLVNEDFQSSDYDVTDKLEDLRFTILVVLGKTKEAICYAKNVGLTKEVSDLLLIHNHIEDAVAVTLDKVDLTAEEAKLFASNISKDTVGKFLIGLKAVTRSDPTEILP